MTPVKLSHMRVTNFNRTCIAFAQPSANTEALKVCSICTLRAYKIDLVSYKLALVEIITVS